MREIKFRAWDKTKKHWVTSKNFESETSLSYDTNYLVFWNNYELSQYTGLKDKNSKEIYEGDIVQMLYTDWSSQSPNIEGKYDLSLEDYKKSKSKNGVVVYSYDRYYLEFEYGKYGNIYEGTHGEKFVIGNIYESKHLLDNTE